MMGPKMIYTAMELKDFHHMYCILRSAGGYDLSAFL